MQSSNLRIGTVLKSPTQEYRIDQVLGAGSFGITYLATSKVKYGNVSFNVKFAIKEHFMETCFRDEDGVFVHCTPTSRKNVEHSRKDFLKEAKRLQDICQYSKNIVHVNEAFEANGTAYYVMEYLNGGSPKSMDEKSAIWFITQIAEAVQILHEHKLLHLDIKPDNIVLKTAEDGTLYPVLIDFGITKHFDDKGNPTTSPNAKGISLGYAPIEQNDTIREFAPTLDIYALGATLLYLLTGQNPPSSVKLIDPTQKELKRLIPSDVSQQTRSAILNAMNPNKGDRTQNVSSFLKDLKFNEIGEKKEFKDTQIRTEPINQKKCSFTKPLNKSHEKKESNNTFRWNGSHWALLITFLLSFIGLWFFDSEILIIGICCIVGICVDFALCSWFEKIIKINFLTLFSFSLLIFILISLISGIYTPLYVALAEIPLSGILLFSIDSNKNTIRWIISSIFLGIAFFFGYVWFSYNVLQARTNDVVTTSETEIALIGEDRSPLSDELKIPEALRVLVDSIEKNMVYVEGGTFTMGATPEMNTKLSDHEKPVHKVTLSSFYISKYEVTQDEWEAVLGYNPNENYIGIKGTNVPATHISWDDCQIFIDSLNKISKFKFRLPTEAEWEFAARGGTFSKRTKYSGGNNAYEVANVNFKNFGSKIGQKKPNELGLYDMTGNASEWCQDSYAPYTNETVTDPLIELDNTEDKVNRGGGWGSTLWQSRISNRNGLPKDNRGNGSGMRLAATCIE